MHSREEITKTLQRQLEMIGFRSSDIGAFHSTPLPRQPSEGGKVFKSNSFLGLHDKSMRKHRRASSVPRGAGRGWRVDPDFKFWWNQRNPQLTFGVVSQRILIYHGNIGQASASRLLSSCMTAGRLGVGFVRNVIQEAILPIEAEIDERKGLISKLRKLGVRPAAVDRADGAVPPK